MSVGWKGPLYLWCSVSAILFNFLFPNSHEGYFKCMRDTHATGLWHRGPEQWNVPGLDLDKGSSHAKVKTACRDPGRGKFLKGFWTPPVRPQTRILFSYRLCKRMVCVKRQLPSWLWCEGIYGVGKPIPYSCGSSEAVQGLQAAQQHPMGKNAQFGLV